MPSLVDFAASDCNVPVEWVEKVLRAGSSSVAKIKVPKKSGNGYRLVSRPSAELEILQRWLVLRFFNECQVHEISMAFLPRKSILTNAEFHSNGKYFIRIDFKDFFSSITLNDLVCALFSNSHSKNQLTFFDDYREFLRQVCFDFSNRLPIGYISSPIISNVVMWQFDVELVDLISVNQNLLGHCRVSRYADDIVFSTDKRGGCAKFLELFSKFVKSRKYPSLHINGEKTAYSSKAAGTAMVTGLRVCQDGHITVTKKYKDKVRLMLSLYEKGKLKNEDFLVLRGHISYLRGVSPAFFSKLCLKYVNVISKFT